MSEVQDTQYSTAAALLNTIKQKLVGREVLTLDEIKSIVPAL